MNTTRLILTFLFALFGAPALAQGGAQPRLPVVQLSAGIHVIHAEAATTGPQRSSGLMFRRELPANGGMLFLFEDKANHCMWMRNTLIPLSVAFIADDGTIANIAEMEPRTENSHCAARPVRFALEMSKGWFAKRGIRAGAKISGLPTP